MAKTKVVRGLCTVDGCTRVHKARGYCAVHYQHFLRGVPVRAEVKTRDRTPHEHCSEEDCLYPVKAKGLCATHYARLLRHGHVSRPNRITPRDVCSVPNCDSYLYAKGLCHQHYARARKGRLKYGLPDGAVEKMVQDQNGLCAICHMGNTAVHGATGKIFALSVDHCHSTKTVRGMLCHQCNRALGMFQDSPVVLTSALLYLAKHSLIPSRVLDEAISALQSARATQEHETCTSRMISTSAGSTRQA